MSNKNKIQCLVISTLLLTMMMSLLLVQNVSASPATNTVKLNLHEVSAKELWTGNTTTHIMNTTGIGYWSSSAQELSVKIPLDNTFYTLDTFWLWCKTAGAVTIESTATHMAKLYLKANKTLTSAVEAKIEMWKTTTAGANTTIGTTSTTGPFSLNTTYQFIDTIAYTFGSDTTVETSNYIQVKISLNSTIANATITMAYDTATYPSRIELGVNDHITVNSITITPAGGIYAFDESITATISVSDDFGIYDIKTVYLWFRPTGFSVSVGTSQTATAPSGASTGTGNSGSWTVTLTPQTASANPDYYNIEWKPWSGAIDNTGGTGGDEAGVRGGGDHTSDDTQGTNIMIQYQTSTPSPPPSWLTIVEWTMLILGIPLYMWTVFAVVIVTCIVVVFVFVLGGKEIKRKR